jgi:hypothetical protein
MSGMDVNQTKVNEELNHLLTNGKSQSFKDLLSGMLEYSPD